MISDRLGMRKLMVRLFDKTFLKFIAVKLDFLRLDYFYSLSFHLARNAITMVSEEEGLEVTQIDNRSHIGSHQCRKGVHD